MIPIVIAFGAGAIAGCLGLEGYYKYSRKPKPNIRKEIALRVKAVLDSELVTKGGLSSASLQDLRDAQDVHTKALGFVTEEIYRRRAVNRAKNPTVTPSVRENNG